MDVWKERPGLEATLMRTIGRRYFHDTNHIRRLNEHNLKERYNTWRITEEAQFSAANAIKVSFIQFKNRKENCFKRLSFSKILIPDDIIQEILKFIK
tara:strand:+ start:710 stop:1000 length:291 start_codon:yes stop_codon:yes gene_type:complete